MLTSEQPDTIDREPLGYISDDCAALLAAHHAGRGYIYPYASPEHNTPLCLDSDRAWLQGQLLDARSALAESEAGHEALIVQVDLRTKQLDAARAELERMREAVRNREQEALQSNAEADELRAELERCRAIVEEHRAIADAARDYVVALNEARTACETGTTTLALVPLVKRGQDALDALSAALGGGE